MRARPIIHVSAMGNLGNRMIQYMAAMALAARLPGARFSRVELAEWGIVHLPLESNPARTIMLRDDDTPAGRIDLDGIAARLLDGEAEAVDFRCYAQNVANFLPGEAYRQTFPAAAEAGGGEDELLINIRQGDILDAHHPDYVLAPGDFYAAVVERMALRPVFMGQLEDTPYLAALRGRFPEARFLPSRGAIADFSAICNSVNILLCVSTFSWLAGFLSGAQRIVMPVLGVLNPLQCRMVDLQPIGDPRWIFYQFPFHYAVAQDRLGAAHDAIRGLWREMPEQALRTLQARSPALPPRDDATRARYLLESRYLADYPDVAEAVANGGFPSGRHHYTHHGRFEGRRAVLIDAAWYCTTYPIAAVELGQGDAADPLQHWLEIGRARGYRRSALEN